MLGSLSAQVQRHALKVYQTSEGLQTNLTKGVFQDRHGFIWIASDLGVIRFDGKNFRKFDIELPINYPKEFMYTSDGRLLLVHDNGIAEITQNLETGEVNFSTVLPGGSKPGPENVMFPKSMYEDKKGNIWIGEVFSIAKYNGEDLKRYRFSKKYRTGSFIRSFEFAEDDKSNLFASSQQGHLFWYDPSADKFSNIEIRSETRPGTINALVLQQGTNTVWAASDNGIFEIRQRETQSQSQSNNFYAEQIIDLQKVSTLAPTPEGSVYAGGWNSQSTGLSIIKREQGEWVAHKVSPFSLNTINHLHYSDGDLWVATDEGIGLVFKTPFNRLPLKHERSYIQSLTQHPERNTFFMTDAYHVYQITPGDDDFAYDTLFTNTAMDDLLTVAAGQDGIWVGSSLGDIYFIPYNRNYRRDGGHVKFKITKENENSVYHGIVDQHNDFWYLKYNETGVRRIKHQGDSYSIEKIPGADQPINVIREGPAGHIYAGGSESGELELYRYNRGQQQFEPLITDTGKETNVTLEGFAINDLTVNGAGNIYVAGNRGILRYDVSKKAFEHVDLGSPNLNSTLIKAVDVYRNDELWFGTENGTYHANLDRDFVIEFDEEKGGIPSRTITDRGVLTTPENQVWVATPAGVGILNKANNFGKTSKPILLNALVDSEPVDFSGRLNIANNSVLQLEFVSLTHPGSGVTYEYRLSSGDNWNDIGNRNEVTLSGLQTDMKNLQIRALQSSGYTWSDPLSIPMNISPPWYLKTGSIILYLFVIISLMVVSTYFYNRRLQRSKEKLEKMVEERVKELRQKNKQLKRARQKVEDSERKYRSFYELSPVGIAINKLEDGTLIDCNEQLLNMTGYAFDEIRQYSLYNLTSDRYEQEKEKQFKKVKETGRYGPFETELIHREGHSIPVLANGVKLTDTDGNELVYSIIQDITERKNFEKQLLKLNKDKDRLVATIAHDIRNPLSLIHSFSELLLENDSKDSEERRKLEKMIHDNTDTALTISSNLLELATLEAEAENLEKKEFKISTLFGKLHQKFAGKAAEKDIALKFHGDDKLCVYGDPDTLERMCDNLVSNALKFTQENGEVDVSASRKEDEDGEIVITVSDTGVGIPEHLHNKLFDRFTAAKREGLRGEHSTGLGMSIVKEIVEQHDGSITFESEEGVGTTFYVTLEAAGETEHVESA